MNRRRASEERFRQRYALPLADAALEVEREAIGANVGANGYTTVEQAGLLAQKLGLTPAHLLLDIGSGRGWPGVYLAQATGCRAVLADLPEPALRAALKRTAGAGLTSRVSIVQSSAIKPPFRPRVFDAISHTDTL
jgi:methylase of polypeptide subunit release factors